jgi:3-hydroxyisobutyrate dehydrogenase-like beta-hydroxyacid dehydrogenase
MEAPIGFVGLGQMGRHMAANLVDAAKPLLVYGRKADVVAELQAKGAIAVAEPADLREASILFLCLPDGNVISEFLLGPEGIANLLRPGTIIVDTSTSGFRETIELAATLAALGLKFMDAPVSGMEARARDGTLTIMCGGEADLFGLLMPLFSKLGSTILRVGDVGSGQLMKLVNQLLFDINAAALAEILPMAAKLGLDPSQVAAVVNSGTGRSYASEFFAPRILARHFGDGYPLKAAYKDLVSGADISARLGLPMPVLAAATATYQQALLRGHGAKDKGAMILVFEELLGVAFQSSQAAAEQSHG